MKRIAKLTWLFSVLCLLFWLFPQKAESQYAHLPYHEDFEYGIPNIFKSFPANSWTTKKNSYTNFPEGVNLSEHSAGFPSSYLISNDNGYLDLYLDFSGNNSTKYLSFWYMITCAFSKGGIKVLLSTDGGVSFGESVFSDSLALDNNAPLEIISTGWVHKIINLNNIDSPTGIIRFQVYGRLALDDLKAGTFLADFTSDKNNGFAPLDVHFTDNSKGEPDHWNWDFDNNGIADAITQNATHRYDTAGLYPVGLLISKPLYSDNLLLNDYIRVYGYAPLPFNENFENWVNGENYRDVPSVYWKNAPFTGNNSWSRNRDGYRRGAWYSNEYFIPPREGSFNFAQFNSSNTDKTGSLDAYVDLSMFPGGKFLSFYYINSSGTDRLNVMISQDEGISFNTLITLGTEVDWKKIKTDMGDINSKAIIRFEATGDYGKTDIGLDDVKIGTLYPDFTADVSNGALPLTVHFQNQSSGTPTTTQWDFNNDGVIDDAASSPTYTYTTAGIYSVKLIISDATSSDTLLKTQYIEVNKYATVPFSESFENEWLNRNVSLDVPSDFWKVYPDGFPPWRRNDDFGSAGAYSPGGANGSVYSARGQSTCCNTGARENNLDLHIDLSPANNAKYLSFWYINISGKDSLHVMLSTNGGNTFVSLKKIGIQPVWTKSVADLTEADSPLGVIRFKAISSNTALSDIGLDEVRVGDIVSDFASDKLSGNPPLTVQFYDQSKGIPASWQWDFDNDGTVDDTRQNPIHIFNEPGFYSVKLKVTNEDSSSDSILKKNSIIINSYASLPFTENFENVWIDRDCIQDVPSIHWKNNPANDNSSWSRDDSGAKGEHSARFHSYENKYSGYNSDLDAFVNFSSQTGTKGLSFWYNNLNGNDSLFVYLSIDGGATFGQPILKLGKTQDWYNVRLRLGDINSSQGIIKFEANGNYSQTDLGIDDIKIDNLIADFNSDAKNNGFPLTIQFTDKSVGDPVSWKWDFNNDGITDATTQNPIYIYDSFATYSVKLIISNGVSSDTVVKKNKVNAYASFPFSENFEGPWIDRDAISDVPSIYWRNTPPQGINSWYQADHGVDGSLHSACFNALGNYEKGKLDLYIDFSTDTTDKILNFRYFNIPETALHTPSYFITSTITVYLSVDGGLIFNEISVLGPINDWGKVVINLGKVTSSKGIIRFEGSNNSPALSNIYIDDVKIYKYVPPSYASIPYSESFDGNWDIWDGAFLTPSKYWTNTNGMWRSKDESAYFYINNYRGFYHNACFDLHLDFSTAPGKKYLTLNYSIMKGPMSVKISLDGGSSFDEIYYFDKNDELPGQAIIDLGKSDSKTAVIRLEGYLERVAPESIISISDLSVDNLDNDPDNVDNLDNDPDNVDNLDNDPDNVDNLENNPDNVDNLDNDPDNVDNLGNDPDNIVTVYPTVTNGIINIKFRNIDNEKVNLYLIDLKGNVLLSRNLSGEENIQLDLSGYSVGIYYIRTDFKGRSVTNMIIKN